LFFILEKAFQTFKLEQDSVPFDELLLDSERFSNAGLAVVHCFEKCISIVEDVSAFMARKNKMKAILLHESEKGKPSFLRKCKPYVLTKSHHIFITCLLHRKMNVVIVISVLNSILCIVVHVNK
jgi:hypothetical protein